MFFCNSNNRIYKNSKGRDCAKNHVSRTILCWNRKYSRQKFDKTTWNLVDLTPGEKKPLNIHFFLWPFYTTYRYPFAYTKFKKLGAINKDDIIAWKDDETGDCIVVRKGVSNHVKFRAEYPSVTSKLDTKELATVNIITTHVLELVNIIDIFKIDSWFVATMSKIDATLKGLVSKKKLLLLNRFSSEDKGKFSNTMFGVNTDEIDPTTGGYSWFNKLRN